MKWKVPENYWAIVLCTRNCDTRDLVHAVMYNVDPALLEERTPLQTEKTEGSLHVQGNRLGTFSRWA